MIMFFAKLKNVIDIVEHNQIDSLGIQHIEINTPILEPIQPLNTSGVAYCV